MEQLYTISEVCSITKLSVHTIRAWIQRKKIKVVKMGKSVRISQSELERLIKGE